MHRALPLGLTVVALLWTLTIVAAPRLIRSPSFGAIAAELYAASGRICHQKPQRSFHLAGVPMPVCARCSGLYASGAAGALIAWIGLAPSNRSRTRMLLLVGALPTALTWSAEAAGLMATSNVVRALAAVPLGAAAGWVFVRMLRYDAQLDARKIHDGHPRAHSL